MSDLVNTFERFFFGLLEFGFLRIFIGALYRGVRQHFLTIQHAQARRQTGHHFRLLHLGPGAKALHCSLPKVTECCLTPVNVENIS